MLLTSQVKGLGPSGGAAACISRPLPVGVTVKHTKKREEVLKNESRKKQGAGEDKKERRRGKTTRMNHRRRLEVKSWRRWRYTQHRSS